MPEENDQISAPPLNTRSKESETLVATGNSRPMAAKAALWFNRLRSAPALFLQKAPEGVPMRKHPCKAGSWPRWSSSPRGPFQVLHLHSDHHMYRESLSVHSSEAPSLPAWYLAIDCRNKELRHPCLVLCAPLFHQLQVLLLEYNWSYKSYYSSLDRDPFTKVMKRLYKGLCESPKMRWGSGRVYGTGHRGTDLLQRALLPDAGS